MEEKEERRRRDGVRKRGYFREKKSVLRVKKKCAHRKKTLGFKTCRGVLQAISGVHLESS